MNNPITTLDVWNLSTSTIGPPASRLFSLQPIGNETPYVESLTGYIARLSQEHFLTVGTLISKELTPKLNKDYLKQLAKRGGSRFYDHARALNGVGSDAYDFVEALESLTGRLDLLFLTMLPWVQVLPHRGLLRKYRAWCPDCFQERLNIGQPIYEQLLWNLQPVTVCPLHNCQLNTNCPECGVTMNHLKRRINPGFCSNCNMWLGKRSNIGQDCTNEVSSSWKLWVARNVGNLVASGPLHPAISRKNIAHVIQHAVRSLTQGNVSKFSKILNVPKVTTWEWCSGKSLPPLESLLRISYVLNTSLVNLFIESNEVLVHTGKSLPGDWAYTSTASKTVSESFEKTKTQNQLREELSSTMIPPLSMKHTADKLGYNKRLLYKHFPELCSQISQRYQCYQASKKAERKQKLSNKILEAIDCLKRNGVYPSRRSVESLVSLPAILKEGDLQQVWTNTLIELDPNDKV